MGKHWNRPERYGDAIRRIRRHGIDVSTEMIIGIDTDDESAFDRTLECIMENRISLPRVHILTPIPGTPLFERLRREGRILTTDFAHYTGGQVTFRPLRLDPGRLQQRYWSLYERLFSWRSILKRIWRNPASLGLIMRGVVIATNLHYRDHVRRRICPGIV